MLYNRCSAITSRLLRGAAHATRLRAKSRSFTSPPVTVRIDHLRNRPFVPKLIREFGQKVFSGIQPTGDVHLGNYLGAIHNWVQLQNAHPNKVLFSIVDLHSLTTSLDRAALEHSTRELTAALLACGIDPAKSILYNQSKVSGHSELAWILACLAPMSRLKMMIQFKDKSKSQKEPLTGLFTYPILMAADIMLYRASHVPVGEDQRQHIELTRELAEKFNRTFGEDYFPACEVLSTEAKRVMSLRDGTKKMSKSEPSEMSRIALKDDPDTIAEKIRRAKTDLIHGVSYDVAARPEVSNLVTIFSAVSGRSIESICQQYANTDLLAFKLGLTEALVEHLNPIRLKYERYLQDPSYLQSVLDSGGKLANDQAQETLSHVRRLVGLM